MSFQAIFCLLHKTLLLFIKALFSASLIHVRLSFRPCSHSISFPSAFIPFSYPFNHSLFSFNFLSIHLCSIFISFLSFLVLFKLPFFLSLFSFHFLSFLLSFFMVSFRYFPFIIPFPSHVLLCSLPISIIHLMFFHNNFCCPHTRLQ